MNVVAQSQSKPRLKFVPRQYGGETAVAENRREI